MSPSLVHYVAVGHLTHDLTPTGPRLGGSVAYAALTAHALGYPAGIVTAHGAEADVSALRDVAIAAQTSSATTTFENIYQATGRAQWLRAQAAPLTAEAVPAHWRAAPILHLAPLAGELTVDTALSLRFPFVGLTPQGWLRAWDADGRVFPRAWVEAAQVLPHTHAAIISIEDIGGEWAIAEQWAKLARVLVITEGAHGCTVFVRGQSARQFIPPAVAEVDPTGAGDIFAAAFFIHLYETDDAWAAAQFANHLAALSVTRPGLAGVPTADEISLCRMKVEQDSRLKLQPFES